MNQRLHSVIEIAKQAGQAIMAIYRAESSAVIQIKSDCSPLTQADLQANAIIVAGLQKLTPDIPVISEEMPEILFDIRSSWESYWLIDPLDGTKEFLQQNDEFTVNIALIKNNYPILGVVYAPVLATCYYAAEAQGAFKQIKDQPPQPIHTKPWQAQNTTIAVSRRHNQATLQGFLQQFKQPDLITCGSSLKFCLVADGKADIYPRLSPTSEWDTAAAQCIVEQAGGIVLTTKGERLCYNKKESLINPQFLAAGDANHDWRQYF